MKRLTRLFRRRSPKKPIEDPDEKSHVEQAVLHGPRNGARTLITWESELRSIAAETSAWTIETGGDLFGRWNATPAVYLATKAGPKAQRSNAHFRLDVDYLRELSEPLAGQWALRYFGDWHSHHRLGLHIPSSGDQRRIRQLGDRNQFPGMAEIIVTTEGSHDEPIVRIHPWIYDLAVEGQPSLLRVKVLRGVSPVRQALIARGNFPEQDLAAWERVPLARVRVSDEPNLPLEEQPDADATTRERTLAHLADALKQASGSAVEQHATAFGHILVAKLEEPAYLGFAIEGKWPMAVLEVDRLDRAAGTTRPIETRKELIAPDIAGILEVFYAAKGKGA